MIVTKKYPKYSIKKPKTPHYEDTPENQIKVPHLALIVAMKNGGKTVSTSSKLTDLKRDGFNDRTFVISPTIDNNFQLYEKYANIEDCYTQPNNDTIDDILLKIEEEADTYFKQKKQIELYDKLMKLLEKDQELDYSKIDPDFIMECYECELLPNLPFDKPTFRYGHNRKPKMIILVDDCQSTPLMLQSTKNKFINLCLRHRHIYRLGCSIFILAQTMNSVASIPKSIRNNCSLLCIFKQRDKSRIKALVDEVGCEIPEEDFMKLYDYATEKPFGFLCIEFLNPIVFRCCWDEVIDIK